MKRTQIVYKRWRFLRLTCLWEYFKHHHQPHKGKWCSLIIMACEKDDSRSRCEFTLLLFPRSVACSGESLETSKNTISVVNCSKKLMVIGGILAPSSSITGFRPGATDILFATLVGHREWLMVLHWHVSTSITICFPISMVSKLLKS